MNWGSLFNSQATAAEVNKKQKRCILLWMNGGASQFETFDMKIGRPTGGLFREISTNVPGTRVCELMPKIAQNMDKLAVIRSMRTSQVDHPGGIHLMHTGYSQAAGIRFPEIGGVIAKYLGREGSDLPNFIKIFSHGNTGAGFLGPKYQPFSLSPEGKLPTFSTSNLNPTIESRRNELRNFVEDIYARRDKAETARMHREAYAAARRLQNVQSVFKIDDEWDKYRDLYGDSAFGRRCMMARRLVEEGVPFVEVGQSSYDSHADNFVWHRGLVPPMERAWAGLLIDLEQRGLLEHTLGRVDGRNRPHAADQQPQRPRPLRPVMEHRVGRLRRQRWIGLRRIRRRRCRCERQSSHRRRLLRHDLSGAGNRSGNRALQRRASDSDCAVWLPGRQRRVGLTWKSTNRVIFGS